LDVRRADIYVRECRTWFQNNELLQSAKQVFGVRRIGLFGSFARGEAGETSDVDLVVEFDRPIGFRFMELGDYLEQLLGRRVDLLTPEGVRTIRNPRIAREIAASLVYV